MKYIRLYEDIDFDDIVEEEFNDDNYFDGHKEFYNFLVRNDALDKYINNYDYRFVKTGGVDNIGDFLDYYDVDFYIDYAFNWDNSPEGRYYWEDLNRDWEGMFYNIRESIDFDDIVEEEYEDNNMKHKFISFLRYNNSYDEYVRYFDPNYGSYNGRENVYTIDEFLDTCPIDLYLRSAFLWRNTEEGNGYWERLNNKWIKSI